MPELHRIAGYESRQQNIHLLFKESGSLYAEIWDPRGRISGEFGKFFIESDISPVYSIEGHRNRRPWLDRRTVVPIRGWITRQQEGELR